MKINRPIKPFPWTTAADRPKISIALSFISELIWLSSLMSPLEMQVTLAEIQKFTKTMKRAA